MSRNITAATIHRADLGDLLPIAFDLRQASMDPKLSREARLMSRLAARFILGNVDNAQMDMTARIQVLEGASGTEPLGPFAGKWWKKGPRQGMADAKDFYAGTDIDPSWFSTGNTGMVGMTLALIGRRFNSWTKGRQVHFTPEDILSNGMNGLLKDGTTLAAGGPYFFQTGLKKPGIRKNIPKGKDTPRSVAGVAAKFFEQKVNGEFQKGDKNRAPTMTPEGDDAIEMLPSDASPVDFTDFLVAVLSSGSPLGRKLEQRMRALAGKSELANEVINRIKAGGTIGSISGISKQMGGSGSGGSVRWVKKTFYPAVAKLVQNDSELLLAFHRSVGHRRASQQRQADFGRTILDSLVDRRGLIAVRQVMSKAGDQQSADLLRDIQTELLSKLDLDTGTENAVNRLAGLASKGKTWDPALIRNNIFKVANSLGMRLPSGMFS